MSCGRCGWVWQRSSAKPARVSPQPLLSDAEGWRLQHQLDGMERRCEEMLRP
jgi:hypothetical protein